MWIEVHEKRWKEGIAKYDVQKKIEILFLEDKARSFETWIAFISPYVSNGAECFGLVSNMYKGVYKSFRTGHLESEP
jgi:hypothetical protein